MDVAKQAVKGSFYSAGAGYFLQICGIIFGIILARLLDPNDFGIIALATVIFSFIARIRVFGFNYALIHKKDVKDVDLSTHFLLQNGLNTLIILSILILMPLLQKYYEPKIIHILLIIAILNLFGNTALSSTPFVLLQKELKYKQLSLLNVISAITSNVVAITLAFLGFGVWALVALTATGTLINFAGFWYFSTWKPSLKFNMDSAKWFFSQGKHLWLSGMSGYIIFSFDDLLIGSLIGTTVLGFYTKAYNFSKLPMGMISAVLGVALPTYSKLQDDRAGLSKAYTLVLDVVALVSFPLSVLLAITAPEFIVILIGEKWLPAVPLLQLLLLYSFLRPIMDGTFSLPIALGKPKILSHIGIVQTILMLILCSILTYFYGAAGAAISAGVVVLVGIIMISKFFVMKYLEIDYKKIFIPPLISLSLAVIAVFAVLHYFPVSDLIMRFAVKTSVIGLVYILVLFAIEGKDLKKKIKYIYGLVRK